MLTGEKWIGMKEAREVLAMSLPTLRRILDRIDRLTQEPLIRFYRPTPGRFLLAEASVIALKTAIEADCQFWRKRTVRKSKARPLKVTCKPLARGLRQANGGQKRDGQLQSPA